MLPRASGKGGPNGGWRTAIPVNHGEAGGVLRGGSTRLVGESSRRSGPSVPRGCPAAVVDVSSDSSRSTGELGHLASASIKKTLCGDYKKALVLNRPRANWGETRWMPVKTHSGRTYMVQLKKGSNDWSLTTGWDLVVICECLREGQTICLSYSITYIFLSAVHPPSASARIGFAIGLEPSAVPRYTRGDYIVAWDTYLTDAIRDAMQGVWAVGNSFNPIYVCTIKESQQNGGSMWFSKEYSDALPHRQDSVALRFLGSPVVICGSIHRYTSGARIIQGWSQFVDEHQVVEGDVLIFRCFRGPTAWEMLVCRP